MEKLISGYHFEQITQVEFQTFFSDYRKKVFSENFDFSPALVMSELEKDLFKENNGKTSNLDTLYVGVYHNEEIIAWHFGYQIDAEEFYMCNTGVFREHQNKGVYTALLPKIISIIRNMGYQKITSKHHASNNAVLIPKLKAGFTIKGMEISDKFGTMVKLVYYTNKKRAEIHKIRAGELKPDNEYKKLLNLE